jgi:hypothetical protein
MVGAVQPQLERAHGEVVGDVFATGQIRRAHEQFEVLRRQR